MISYDDFQKMDLRIAKVIEAERVEGSEKLLRLRIDVGDREEKEESAVREQKFRQIIAGIGKVYRPEDMIGKNIVILANLEPKTFTIRNSSGQISLKSQGMLLAAGCETGPILLTPEKEADPGSKIK